VTVRDYYVAPGPPPPGDGENAERAEARLQVAWEMEARNQISLAWHAIDVRNYGAATEALDHAKFYIKALGTDHPA